MDDTYFPWSFKDSLIFALIVSGVTCPFMVIMNTWRATGTMNLDILAHSPVMILIMWPIAFFFAKFFASRISGSLVPKILAETDGYNARILCNVTICVALMSTTLTLIGTIVACIVQDVGTIEECFASWPTVWPINFCLAFWYELFFAQPIGRYAMHRWHIRILSKQNGDQ